jgi:hypothetical protein
MELSAEEREKHQALQRQFDQARNELLSPEEREELRIRSSRESLWAGSLSGFEPSEEEWRNVSRLRADFEESQRQLSRSQLGDEEQLHRQEELQAKLDEATKTALGSDRFARYQLASDPQFQELHRVTERYGVSDAIAAQAHAMRLAALAQAQQLRDNSNLSEESRNAALKSIQRETERALTQTLGVKVFATYKEYSSSWEEYLKAN